MAQKKAPEVKKPVPRGKKPIGMTSAIGPKATTALVICVIAGGLMVAARQQEDAKKKNPPPTAFVEMAPIAAAKPTSPKRVLAASTAPGASPAVTATPAAGPPESGAKMARATVIGCLEDDGAAFRLTDTTGADAPKARSWKSGFIKKGNAPVKLVGSSNGLSLASHVGRRVSVTGTLANREMQAQAMHRVSGSCKAN